MITVSSPPSMNALWRNVPGVGRVRTKAYKTWAKDAGWDVKRQVVGVPTITCRFNMDVEVPISRRDTDNFFKALGDLAQSIGLVANDANLHQLIVTPTARADCKVTITTLPDMGGIRAAPKPRIGNAKVRAR